MTAIMPRLRLAAGAAILFLSPILFAQQSRIPRPIQSRQRVALRGQIPPQARPENDQGPVDPSLNLVLTLALRPSAEQQTDLNHLLAAQQDPASPDYHRWLTPEQFAGRFGASPEDIARITDWLQQQGLAVVSTARARNAISVRATAAQAGAVFGAEIHNYQVNGRRHFANATEPTLPAELGAIVSSVEGLNDFLLQPRGIRPTAAGELQPNYTSGTGRHYLSPDDFATIYNLKPLYAQGIDGAGQVMVVAGQAQVSLADIRTFRTRFGLPASDPELMLVPGSFTPTSQGGDVDEAHLDLEWAGAIARNARILYVYSYSVMDAVRYAVDQNLAPVISVSYGLCEPQTSSNTLRSLQSTAQQANAQGITWVNSSGDSGGSDCTRSGSTAGGPSVDAPASVPEVTGIGGTRFDDSAGVYWNADNGPTSASVLSYIPEVVWNDSTSGSPSSGGGGASQFFLKPAWQSGAGVPNDGSRDVPDVSLSASPNHVGYLVYSGGSLAVYGGTSTGAPAFAGLVVLLNQYLIRTGAQASAGVGNVNTRLYALAQSVPQVFHDITTGDNIVQITCGLRARSCQDGSFGYTAGPGYDLASGLGSIDGYNLVTSWKSPLSSVTRITPSMTLGAAPSVIPASGSVTLTATLIGTNGVAPEGSVAFFLGDHGLGTATLSASGSVAKAAWTITGALLSVGASAIRATYSGDVAYNAASATTAVTVTSPVSGRPAIAGVANAGSFRPSFAPGMLLSIFGSGLAPATWSATSTPLPLQIAGVSVSVNGVAAPVLYVSPGQLNVQVPYEATPGAQASLVVNNNGAVSSTSFLVAETAPGIFTNAQFAPVPDATAQRGQSVTLFFTGAGFISPPFATGTAPDPSTPVPFLPAPVQDVSVTVGGIPATITFAGVGPGLVGVIQVNYQVPDSVPLGANPVVVSVGAVDSPPASLTVTN